MIFKINLCDSHINFKIIFEAINVCVDCYFDGFFSEYYCSFLREAILEASKTLLVYACPQLVFFLFQYHFKKCDSSLLSNYILLPDYTSSNRYISKPH